MNATCVPRGETASRCGPGATPSVPAARRFAQLAGMPYRSIRWPFGTVSNWQNHRFPGTSSFVVELPPGPLTPLAARPYAQALLRLAQ